MDYDDICYECSGYGDNYFINDDGDLECRCNRCIYNFVDDERYDYYNDEYDD